MSGSHVRDRPALIASAPASYRPRRPEDTTLYRVAVDHLETFVAYAREHYERPLPRYVENEFRDYLKCGVFAFGFLRCKCDTCGHDFLVGFSCKNRGVSPSCSARRMCNSAAHLVDRVMPQVPVRQWALSLPFELRRLLAFRADVLTAVARIFYETVSTDYRRRSGIVTFLFPLPPFKWTFDAKLESREAHTKKTVENLMLDPAEAASLSCHPGGTASN